MGVGAAASIENDLLTSREHRLRTSTRSEGKRLALAQQSAVRTPMLSRTAYRHKTKKHLALMPKCLISIERSKLGGRCRVRTCDPCRVKAVLYR